MEMKTPEFEEYLLILNRELRLDHTIKKEISKEIYLNLYDKFNELLIKGYDISSSIKLTLECFEEPGKLAKMFNRVYSKQGITDKFCIMSIRKVIAVAMIISILLLVSFIH